MFAPDKLAKVGIFRSVKVLTSELSTVLPLYDTSNVAVTIVSATLENRKELIDVVQ
jgi:hypothetical protein